MTPGQFCRVANNERKKKCNSLVQPVKRDDGTLAVTDEGIFEEMKKRYGKETLAVKEKDPAWYDSVEQEAKDKNESEHLNNRDRKYSETCSHENSDLTVEEVEAAIDKTV